MAKGRAEENSFEDAIRPPEIVKVNYDNAVLKVRWNPMSYSDFIVTVKIPGGELTNYPASGDRITIDQDLSPDKSYQVLVTGIDNGQPGQSSPSVNIISQQPVFQQILTVQISALSYSLDLIWSACTNADEYHIELLGGENPQIYHTDKTSYKIVNDLDPAINYSLNITPLGSQDISEGPKSVSLEPILAKPVINMLSYSLPAEEEGKVKTVWANMEEVVTAYITQLKATDGSLLENQVSTDPNSEININLKDDLTYTITVSATGSNGVVIGPNSPPLTVIQHQPILSLLSYLIIDGDGTLNVNWNTVLNAGMYGTTITNSEGSKQNFFGSDPSLDERLTFDQNLTYNLNVSALSSDGVVLGPASELFDIIIHSVEESSLNYTGTNLVLDFEIPSVLAGKTFVGELFKNGISINQQSTQNNKITYDQILEKAMIFTTEIRAEDGIVKGPKSPIAFGPYAAVVAKTFDGLNRLRTVTWNENNTGGWKQTSYTINDAGNLTKIETVTIIN
ncbi:MAG: hypothetical protein AAGA77_10470 [Bacteroidota bacterium]